MLTKSMTKFPTCALINNIDLAHCRVESPSCLHAIATYLVEGMKMIKNKSTNKKRSILLATEGKTEECQFREHLNLTTRDNYLL